MHSKITRGSIAVAALGLAAGLVGAAPAQAAPTSTTQVRPGDLIVTGSNTTGSSVAPGATQEFMAQGVHLKVTDTSNSGARGRFATKVPFAQVHAVDYTWYGTDNQPGIFYTLDLDGDGVVDGELQGDLAYGGKDVYLNHDAQEYPASKLPADTLKNLAPCDGATQRSGATDTCTPPNGIGGNFHGSLDDWNRRFAAAGRTATLVGGGWVAQGLKQDGVLVSITYGPDQYVFTNLAKAKVTVDAAAKRAQVFRGQKAKIKGHVEPAGTGAKISLQAKIKGKWTTLKSRTLATSGDFRFGDKPAKMGVNRYRVQVTETNATMAAKSSTIKVRVVGHHHR
jgi:hypothetical protein